MCRCCTLSGHVFHIIHSGFPENLKTLLGDSNSLKVGVGIVDDGRKVLKLSKTRLGNWEANPLLKKTAELCSHSRSLCSLHSSSYFFLCLVAVGSSSALLASETLCLGSRV
ncbi:hypothetical protein L1887_18054 [Cichorium endivia]|nr:hypothetical protein L1887_18054 [Cichorium endivia]